MEISIFQEIRPRTGHCRYQPQWNGDVPILQNPAKNNGFSSYALSGFGQLCRIHANSAQFRKILQYLEGFRKIPQMPEEILESSFPAPFTSGPMNDFPRHVYNPEGTRRPGSLSIQTSGLEEVSCPSVARLTCMLP